MIRHYSPLQHAAACAVDVGREPPGGGEGVGGPLVVAKIAGLGAPEVARVVAHTAVVRTAPAVSHGLVLARRRRMQQPVAGYT